jgi:hypothetical protein
VIYDHRAWVAQLKREGVDAIFTEPLRTGWWTTGVKSLPAPEKGRAEQLRRGRMHASAAEPRNVP